MQRGLVGSGFFPALPEGKWNVEGTPFIHKRTL